MNLPNFPRTIKSHSLTLMLACYFTFALNLSFWHAVTERIELTNGMMWLFAFSIPCILFVILLFIFNIILLPWIGKPLVIALLLLSAAGNYFTYTLGIYLDEDMIRNIFETDTHEASDFITLSNFFWLFISGILPALLLAWVKIQFQPFKKELVTRLLLFIVCVCVFAGFYATSYKEYASFFRNNAGIRKTINPFNYVSGTWKYIKHQSLAHSEFVWLDRNAKQAPHTDGRKTVLIFVLGETARAANFSLQGYGRETNPLLSHQDIFYFKNTVSCGTATAVSVPCLFSSKTRKEFDVDEAKITQNLIDTISLAGYDVSWLENDGGCKGVCDRVHIEQLAQLTRPEHCSDGYCRDSILLEGLEEKIRAGEKDMVVFMHMMGSHGPSYYQRYPAEFRKFTPTCDTPDIQNCPLESIVNTYDNTILYTDYILSSIIDTAKKFPDRDIAVLYVSDHGESLGEGGIYLHGFPYSIAPQEQKHVPFLLWISDKTQARRQIDSSCLRSKAAKGDFSHDNIFHSALGFLNIMTSTFHPELNIFQGCQNV